MKYRNHYKPFARALLVIASLAVLTGGVTFAALQSQLAVVQGNTIQTANADLKVSTNGTTYSRSVEGFHFGAVIPGGQPSPANGYDVFLRNEGSTGLSLRLSVNAAITNTDNADTSKIKIVLTATSGQPISFTLKELIDSQAQGGVVVPNIARMAPTQTLQYKVQVQMDTDAVHGSSATISNLNFLFGATAIS